MRLTPVFLAFSAFLAFDVITPDTFAQVGKVRRLGRSFSSGDAKIMNLRAKAEEGDAQAQFELGFLRLYGDFDEGLDVSKDEGMLWMRKSVAQGYPQALDHMGCLLYKGEMLAGDKVEAVKLFRRAAEQGDAYAQSNLGYCYYKGEGVAKDSAAAVRWFRLAAAKGEVKAQHHLGHILEAGDGVPKNYSEAAKWFFNLALQKEKSDQRLPLEDYPERFRALGTTKLQPASSWIKAAQAGDTLAQYELGMCHEKGEGVAFDRQAAIMWFRKSAQGGYAPAQFVLGYFHQWGNGLEYDHGEVVRWYGKAAAQGYAKAQYNLGRYYGQGQSEVGKVVRGQSDLVWSKIGIPANPGEAVKWYRKAAENGHLLAQYEMGKIYHSGEGVAKDQVEAFKWWLKAAEQGHATSLFNIGVMYYLGRGTTKDFSEAARWFRIRSNQENSLMFFCGVGMPIPRPMVDGIQTPLAPLNDIPEVR